MQAQGPMSPLKRDYSRADYIAYALSGLNKDWKDTEHLSDSLGSYFTNDFDKFRAYFKWATNNLTYTYAATGYDAKKALKTRKAVCAGYADLLTDLCYHAKIQCKTINGFAKTRKHELDIEFTQPNHAWNAVKLDGRWYLVDATWAAGTFDDKTQRFNRSFNEYFFYADSSHFLRQHFPVDGDKYFQMVDTLIDLPAFNLLPIYYSTFYENDMRNEYPKTKNQSYSCTEDFCFSFSSTKPINTIHIELMDKETGVKSLQNIAIEKTGNNYYATTRFEYEGNYYLTVYVNYWSAMDFNLKVSDD